MSSLLFLGINLFINLAYHLIRVTFKDDETDCFI